jgi:hypothetical protein
VKSGVTTVVDNVAKVLAGMNALATQRVMVGIPSTKADRREDGSPINNAQLGYIHENGAPEVNIPARPFLLPGVRADQAKIEEGLRAAANSAFDGKPEQLQRDLTRVGLIGQAAVRKKITDGPFEPLKPATLAARRRRGRTGTKPLIDTAQLRAAINFVIRKVNRQK